MRSPAKRLHGETYDQRLPDTQPQGRSACAPAQMAGQGGPQRGTLTKKSDKQRHQLLQGGAVVLKNIWMPSPCRPALWSGTRMLTEQRWRRTTRSA